MRDLLGLLDVFVLPSYREGLPRSILEAMAMALPVVTTDVRGCREAVRDGETGLVVPARDGRRLAQAITQLARDGAMRKAFGARGRAQVEADYDERIVFRRLEAVYGALGWVPPREPAARAPTPSAEIERGVAAP